MHTFECWKCHEWYNRDKGKLSRSGEVFYPCLKEWWKQQTVENKRNHLKWLEEQKKKQLHQMDIFEVHEVVNSVFPNPISHVLPRRHRRSVRSAKPA